MRQLDWLPPPADWRESLRALASSNGDIWREAVALANSRLDFTRTAALDSLVRGRHGQNPPAGLGTSPVRLAVFGSSTLGMFLKGRDAAAEVEKAAGDWQFASELVPSLTDEDGRVVLLKALKPRTEG